LIINLLFGIVKNRNKINISWECASVIKSITKCTFRLDANRTYINHFSNWLWQNAISDLTIIYFFILVICVQYMWFLFF
jgi:hypothetical protein